MHVSHHGVVTEVLICPYCEHDEVTYFRADYVGIRLREFQCGHGHLHFTQLPDPRETPKRVAA